MTNPLSTLKKLIQSKPLIDELEQDVKTMSKANWKTNLAGVIMLLLALAKIWAPDSLQPKVTATLAAVTGAGLLAAKDHNN